MCAAPRNFLLSLAREAVDSRSWRVILVQGMNRFLKLSDAVSKARADGRPIVALESTIIARGMPYPESVRTAQR